MQVKRVLIYVVALMLLVQPFAPSPVTAQSPAFHVGTYYFEGYTDPLEEVIPFDQLTHICYAFAIPMEDGSLRELQYPEKLAQLTTLAHANDVKVLLSVGGYAYQGAPLEPVFEALAATDESRHRLVREVMAMVDAYDLDGVDVDWEYPKAHSAQTYEQLMLDFYEETSARGLLLGIAATGHASATESEINRSVSAAVLDKLDLVHIMCYDLSVTSSHSPLWFCRMSLEYWHEQRGVAQEKLVLGVPFYARPSWKLFKDLVATDPVNAFYDQVLSTEEGVLDSYYDSIGTMKLKTALALEKAGGIFSWEINMDDRGELSLNDAIERTIALHREIGAAQFAKLVTIAYDGQEIICTTNTGLPFVDDNGRTLIPVRVAAEQMGIDVDYDGSTREAIVTAADVTMTIPLGANYIYVNGQRQELDTEAITKNGRVYLPMRALFETLGATVEWLESSRTVLVLPR